MPHTITLVVESRLELQELLDALPNPILLDRLANNDSGWEEAIIIHAQGVADK
jgi:hypothetical protein